MIESAIESLARSGRLVRVRELSLGYTSPWKAALSGALAAWLLTFARYYAYGINALAAHGLNLLTNRSIDPGAAPPFTPIVYGFFPTLVVLFCGGALALSRRWTIRTGRFIVINIGPVVQIRAGWHVPLGMAFSAALALTLGASLDRLPSSFVYLVVSAGSILAIIAWETVHDWTLGVTLSPSERARAVIEYDLKEALAHDETAVRWHVDRLWFDRHEKRATLQGEFPTKEARDRARQVALRVKGIRDVRLIDHEGKEAG